MQFSSRRSASKSSKRGRQASHLEKIGKLLASQRKTGQRGSCDTRLLLSDGTEFVHSLVIAAHASAFPSLSIDPPPHPPIDLSQFDPDTVRKVIDWMYTGKIRITSDSIGDELAVISFFEINDLKCQVETRLRRIGQEDAVYALNVAASNKVSCGTLRSLSLSLHDALSYRPSDVRCLSFQAARAVADVPLPADVKVPLLNALISWLCRRGANIPGDVDIFSNLTISHVNPSYIATFRTKLKKFLSDPGLMNNVIIVVSTNGQPVVQVKNSRETCLKTEESLSRSRESELDCSSSTDTESTKSSKKRKRNKKKKVKSTAKLSYTRSDMSDIEKLPNPFNYSAKSQDSMSSGLTAGKKNEQLNEVDVEFIQKIPDHFKSSQSPAVPKTPLKKRLARYTPSHINMINDLDDPFTSGHLSPAVPSTPVQSQHTKDERLGCRYTPSEVFFIKKLEDPFAKDAHSKPDERLRYTPSHIDSIRELADPFVRSDYSTSSTRARPSKSVTDHIQRLPNPFIQRLGMSPKPENRARYSPSHAMSINKLTDPFTAKEEPTHSTRARISQSDVNYIRQLPDPFSKQPSNQAIPSPSPGNISKIDSLMEPYLRQKYSDIDITHIKDLPDPFKKVSSVEKPLEPPKSKVCIDTLRSLPDPFRRFNDVDVEHLNTLPDPFMDQNNNINLRAVVTPPNSSSSRTSSLMPQDYRPDFIIRDKSIGKKQESIREDRVARMTASEVFEFNKIPCAFSSKSSLPKPKDKSEKSTKSKKSEKKNKDRSSYCYQI